MNTTNKAVEMLQKATTAFSAVINMITALNVTIQDAYGLIQQSNLTVTQANSTASTLISLQQTTDGLANSTA